VDEKFKDFITKLKDDKLDEIKLGVANPGGRRLTRRNTRKNSVYSQDNIQKVERAINEWRRLYQEQF